MLYYCITSFTFNSSPFSAQDEPAANVVNKANRVLVFIKDITTVQRNYPIGSVDLNRNHSSDVLV